MAKTQPGTQPQGANMNPQLLQAIAQLWESAYNSASVTYAPLTSALAGSGTLLDKDGQLTAAAQQIELMVWRAAEIRMTAMVQALTSGAVPLPNAGGSTPTPAPVVPTPVPPPTGSVGVAGTVGATVNSLVGKMLGS